jgi:hypothetical protein
VAVLCGEAIGLDLGTFTGICRGKPGELPTLSSIDFGKKDDEPHDIFGRAIIFFAQMFQQKPVRLFVEQPIPEFALKSQTQARSTELKYGLLAISTGIARASGVCVERCPISTVRKHFLGQGNLKSSIAKERAFQVCTTLGWNPNNFDEADAGAVWHWGCHKYDPDSVQIVDPLFLNREAIKRK